MALDGAGCSRGGVEVARWCNRACEGACHALPAVSINFPLLYPDLLGLDYCLFPPSKRHERASMCPLRSDQKVLVTMWLVWGLFIM